MRTCRTSSNQCNTAPWTRHVTFQQYKWAFQCNGCNHGSPMQPWTQPSTRTPPMHRVTIEHAWKTTRHPPPAIGPQFQLWATGAGRRRNRPSLGPIEMHSDEGSDEFQSLRGKTYCQDSLLIRHSGSEHRKTVFNRTRLEELFKRNH